MPSVFGTLRWSTLLCSNARNSSAWRRCYTTQLLGYDEPRLDWQCNRPTIEAYHRTVWHRMDWTYAELTGVKIHKTVTLLQTW